MTRPNTADARIAKWLRPLALLVETPRYDDEQHRIDPIDGDERPMVDQAIDWIGKAGDAPKFAELRQEVACAASEVMAARLTQGLVTAGGGSPWNTPEDGAAFAVRVLGKDDARKFFWLKRLHYSARDGHLFGFYSRCAELADAA